MINCMLLVLPKQKLGVKKYATLSLSTSRFYFQKLTIGFEVKKFVFSQSKNQGQYFQLIFSPDILDSGGPGALGADIRA